MKTSTERILTTHVGSLVRPDDVLDMMRARLKGSGDEGAFAACLRNAVAEVVRKQADAGIDIVSDGEYSKSSFQTYAHERLSGFEPRSTPVETPARRSAGRDRTAFPEFYAEYDQTQNFGAEPQLMCTGPIAFTGQAIQKRDIDNFHAALSGVDVAEGFVAAIAPGNFGRGENEFYATEEEFIFASAEALKQEYRAVVDAGFVLQIDAPVGSYDLMALSKDEFRRRQAVMIEALNGALDGIPSDRVRYHVCWGSWNAPHTFDIALADILDLVLSVRADGISLEAANPRHEHEFRVWEEVKLPDGKVLLPGLISHATNIVEHPELVAWRIGNFARLVGRENVIASTDCGFAQGAFTRRVHPTVMWAKLQALSDGARLASSQLW